LDKHIIYFDNNATTPTDPRVVEAMMPYFNSDFGNPSSHHFFGEKARKAVERSRSLIADILNAKQQEIIFTSGATESINLAIKGIAEAYSHKGKHIITTQTEHSAVLDVCKYLERKGFEIDHLSVDTEGLIDVNELENKIRKDTALVCVIYVNNETGVIQPIKEIGEICKSKNIRFLTDATQAIGKIPINVNDLNVDLLCFSGHKFYGPKGIGGLYCRKGVKIEALIHGGGHESGFRSGTLNVPGIVGLAKAFEIAMEEMPINEEIVKRLRDEFENKLLETKKVKLNGHPIKRLYNVSNLCFIEVDPILINNELINIAYAQSSACHSSSVRPSHVLKAMGLSDKKALASFRFSFGKYNTIEEINLILATLNVIFETKTVLNKV
jgi:cysteine desulfurase